MPMTHDTITDALVKRLRPLKFGPPVTHTYNPLVYARATYDLYLQGYGHPPREIILLGMNPGPWGMAQCGVPFGEIGLVRTWLGIEGPVGQPSSVHPKRPVEGFDCTRSEISGKRLWSWARDRFGTPDRFFSRFFVANYCPLMFLEESGRNRTPNALPKAERIPLIAACDRGLQDLVALLRPKFVIGIGGFAAQRAESALPRTAVTVGRIAHPSPANPKANRGWVPLIENEMATIGIRL